MMGDGFRGQESAVAEDLGELHFSSPAVLSIRRFLTGAAAVALISGLTNRVHGDDA
jgi:hypothetical protein